MADLKQWAILRGLIDGDTPVSVSGTYPEEGSAKREARRLAKENHAYQYYVAKVVMRTFTGVVDEHYAQPSTERQIPRRL